MNKPEYKPATSRVSVYHANLSTIQPVNPAERLRTPQAFSISSVVSPQDQKSLIQYSGRLAGHLAKKAISGASPVDIGDSFFNSVGEYFRRKDVPLDHLLMLLAQSDHVIEFGKAPQYNETDLRRITTRARTTRTPFGWHDDKNDRFNMVFPAVARDRLVGSVFVSQKYDSSNALPMQSQAVQLNKLVSSVAPALAIAYEKAEEKAAEEKAKEEARKSK